MKKNLKKTSKGFNWNGFIKSVVSNPASHHVIGWNFGDKFDGFHTWDVNKKGKKVKCKHAPRTTINSRIHTEQSDKD